MASGAHLDLANFDGQGLTNSLKNDIVFHTINSSQKIHLTSGSNVGANLTITSNNIGIKTVNPVSSLDIGTSDSIKVPVGTTAQRPTFPYPGMIRYNTDLLQFEGYTENSWVGMEGIKDVDGNTYIQPENYPGANNNQLKFYTNNTLSMTVDSNQNVGIGTTSPKYTLDVTGNISGSIIRTSNLITPSVFLGNSNNIYNSFNINTTTQSSIFYNYGNVGIGTSSPQGILDIKGNFIANTIEDFEYPPSAMTSDNSILSDGTYKSSCSSNYTASYPAWKVFDKIISDSNNSWIGTSNSYYGSNGLHLRNIVTSNIDGKNSNLGDWIQLQTPYNILVSKYKIYNRYNYSYQAPVNFNLLGSSNAGINWITIDSQTNTYWHKNNSNNAYVNLDDALTFYTFNNSNYYNYYRLSINKIAENAVSSGGSNNFSSNVAIGELKLYGQQQYSTSINTSNLASIYTIDNNIGIGTTNPLGRLQINNINGMEDTLVLANGGNSNEFYKPQITFGYSNSTDYSHYIGTRHDKGYSSNNAIDFYCCNSNQKNSIIWGSTPVMSLLGSGNVGIGTTTPSTALHIYSTSAGLRIQDLSATTNSTLTTYIAFFNNQTGGATQNGFIGYSGSGDLKIYSNLSTGGIVMYTNSLERFKIDNNGYTTFNNLIYMNPSVNNSIDFGLCTTGVPGTSAGTRIRFYGNGGPTSSSYSSGVDYSMGMNSSTLWYNVPSSSKHSFCIAGTENLNVSNGTTTITGNLSVTGTITSTVYDGFIVQNANMYNQTYTYTITTALSNGLYLFHAFWGSYNFDANITVAALGISVSGNITTTLSRGAAYMSSLSITDKTLSIVTNGLPSGYNATGFHCTYKRIHSFG